MRRIRISAGFTALTLLSSCGSSAPPSTTPNEVQAVALSELQQLNARAREGAVTDTLFGTEVADPFRALESESPLTDEWITWQTGRTRTALQTWARQDTATQLEALLRIGTLSGASTYGNQVFFSKRDGTREQPALYVRPLQTRRGQSAEERILIDPLTYGDHAALDWYFPSPTGRFIAFGISQNGDERSTLHIIEVATGRMLDDALEHTKWTDLAWLHSEDGFYYRRYPREGEEAYDAEREDSYNARLFFHRIGEPAASDTLVYAPTDGTFFPSASVSDDDRYVIVNLSRGWSASDVFVFDRGARARGRVVAPDAAHALVTIREGQTQLYDARIHDGQLYLLTNEGAPRYRLLRGPIGAVIAGHSESANPDGLWTEFIPESEATLDGFVFLGDRIAVHEIVDVHSRVRFLLMNGAQDAELALPARGDVASLHGDAETGRLVFTYSSFVNAPTLFSVPRRSTTTETVSAVSCPIDLSAFEVTNAHVASRDGTQIPVSYVHQRGMTPTGNTPVLLNGYGGFNVSLMPTFARHPLYWVSQGGIYAVANLRGGGEFGEEWHRAGNLANKEHVFEDMEASIRFFSESGISTPSRIAITGGSNGGLLMGAMITRAPESFAAAATYVGLYDMVRYHQFPPAEIWATEYGTAASEEGFRWLHAYSPYHRVRDGQPMPQVLVETADHDTRVYWGHSTKFAARLQEATGEANPNVWFYRESQVGHGAGTPVSALVDRYVRLYAFVEHALGVTHEATPPQPE